MIVQAAALLMWRRLRSGRDGLWGIVFLVGAALPGVSFGFLPWLAAVLAFGLPQAMALGWYGSAERRGLVTFCDRHPAASTRLSAASAAVPALLGAIPASLAALAAGAVPWQYWLVLPFASVIAASSVLLVQRAFPAGGISLLALYWLWSFLRLEMEPGWTSLLFLPGYPAWVLAQRTGAPHNDGFVAVSAVIACGLVWLYFRQGRKASS